jgi:inosose dehydratase
LDSNTPNIQIACNSAILRHRDRSLECALQAIRSIGFEWVEIPATLGRCPVASMGFCPTLSLDQDPVALRRQLDALGLRVSQIDSGAFLMGPEGNTYGVAFLNKALRFAKHIGAPYVIAIDGLRKPDLQDEEDAFRQIQQNLNLALQTARLYGVGINVEPHGPLTRSIRGMQRIMSLVEGELGGYLGVNFDTGNTFIAGEDPLTFLRAVAPKVRHFHAKDVAATLARVQWGLSTGIPPSGVAVGDGVIAQNIADCIKYLKSTGWRGVISVETEGLENTRRSLLWLREVLGN